MRVLLVSAVRAELQRVCELYQARLKSDDGCLAYLETGVGQLAAAIRLTQTLATYKPDLVIQAGIAGSLSPDFDPGSVVLIASEYLADLGAEENGQFRDLFDLGLEKPDSFPFSAGKLTNPDAGSREWSDLPWVDAITVNEISTRPQRIEHIRSRYNAVIESMEGAALHYSCLMAGVKFLQIRSVSNQVGVRDKSKWKTGLAIENLNRVVADLLSAHFPLS